MKEILTDLMNQLCFYPLALTASTLLAALASASTEASMRAALSSKKRQPSSPAGSTVADGVGVALLLENPFSGWRTSRFEMSRGR